MKIKIILKLEQIVRVVVNEEELLEDDISKHREGVIVAGHDIPTTGRRNGHESFGDVPPINWNYKMVPVRGDKDP